MTVSTTPFSAGEQTTMTLNGIATIDASADTTMAIPNSGRAVVRIGWPDTMTGTVCTFLVQAFPKSGLIAAADFKPLVDKDGTAVSYTVTDDSIVQIPELSGCAAFQIVSGSSEGSAREIQIACRGDNPVPLGGSSGGGSSEPSANNPNIATFVKPDVTAAGSSGAWTTANSPITLFTVTGLVRLRAYAVITTAITSTAGTGTLAFGVTGSVGGVFSQSTANNTTNFGTGFVWTQNAPSSRSAGLSSSGAYLVNNSGDLIMTIATNNMTAGGIVIYVEWYPAIEGSGATVVAATP